MDWLEACDDTVVEDYALLAATDSNKRKSADESDSEKKKLKLWSFWLYMLYDFILNFKKTLCFTSEIMVFNQGEILFHQLLYILDRLSEREETEGSLFNNDFIHICLI